MAPSAKGATPGSHVRKVMATTMIKMFAMLISSWSTSFSAARTPGVSALAAYLVYAAFTGILVAETMRHSVPPTDPR